MKLPDFLLKAIESNTTSLGTHPAFPPEEEVTFTGYILKNEYNKVMEPFEGKNISPKDLAKTLTNLVTECQKIESAHTEALEKLCSDLCIKIFNIPQDTIDLDMKLVGECDMSKYKMLPQPTPDFVFNDIDEMNMLSDEVYKRRMVNVLIAGASMYYATNITYYVKEIYTIDPKLIGLYADIIKYNAALLFNQPDTIKNIERNKSGRVDVMIGEVGDRIKIESEGIIFPVLFENTVRGLLETAAIHGLPENEKQAQYIIDKADYRLAEKWDMRMGIPLWNIIVNELKDCEFNLDEIGSNFIIMELAKMEPDEFNPFLQNVFKKTNKGYRLIRELVDSIKYNKDKDDFDNYITIQNTKFSINDNTEYTPDELLKEINEM